MPALYDELAQLTTLSSPRTAVSPTITHVSSRSPTPLPPAEFHDLPRDVPLPSPTPLLPSRSLSPSKQHAAASMGSRHGGGGPAAAAAAATTTTTIAATAGGIVSTATSNTTATTTTTSTSSSSSAATTTAATSVVAEYERPANPSPIQFASAAVHSHTPPPPPPPALAPAPLSAFLSSPQRPTMPSSSISAPAGQLRRLIPQDLSQYTDQYLPTAAVPTTSTTLAELAHLIRLQGYQEQRRSHSRVRLHRWLVSGALSARLVHCGELAHRTLVDNFRSDDKKNFASLYNALHDVRNSCDATRRYAFLEPDFLDMAKPKNSIFTAFSSEKAQSFSTFMHEIPMKIRDDLLGFISAIRTNPDFLATRISSLSQQELVSLTSFRPPLDYIDSVIALQARGKLPKKAALPQGPNPVERLLSFQRHDPLAALMFTVFANTSGPDSAEDLRRTDVWATTCARLIIEAKQGSEKFIASVLDVYAGMREWPGKANLELYLMQVIQEGQFLLEKAEDQQSVRPRTQAEPMNSKDTIAADEFYDRAVKRLFEVIDDEPSAGGIPDGVLEIGTAILKKLEDSRKNRAMAQALIVSRWFFTTYLMNAITYPESQGIMMGYHVSDHARQTILMEIAIRAQKLVLDMTYNWKQAVPILPEIRTHIENILARFRHSRSHSSKPVLLPAKAITSPRETVEVQPYIVMCPSDIITLVNTLFPERRPSSSRLDRDLQRHGGLTSGASSISGLSLPFRTSSTPGDASSILSISASSIGSETTSGEPLLDRSLPTTVSDIPVDDLSAESRVTPTEEYGRRIRMACSEMSRILGNEASSGSCHPCAERWAVLYVSPDGKELKTRMRKDSEDEEETDEESPDTDSDDEGPTDRLDLETDYHQLKEAIAKLVEEYEIPKELAPESESKEFSNRTSTHRREPRARFAGKIITPALEGLGSKNPYNSQSQLTNLIASQKAMPNRHRSPQQTRSDSREGTQEKPAVLITMLEAAFNQCQARSDFVNAHMYHKTLLMLRRLSSPSLTRNGYAALLNYFSRGPRDSLGKSASAIEEFEAWFVWLKQSQERHETGIEEMIHGLKNLRDKMWYTTDVRNSAAYEEAKHVAQALKVMGQPTKTLEGKPTQTPRSRNFSKSSSNNFLLKTEAQVLDIMAAAPDQGGPNKLADEQSEITNKWLEQYKIENFCKGEERIHRFCLEVDKCVNKLVGDGILDGPVLWSSELYRRDKDSLDSGRQKGDLFLTGVGTLSIAGDEEYETSGRPGSRSLDFAQRPSYGSLRSLTHRKGSQQSFDSAKWSTGRGMDIMDSQDYFGASSPVLAIDTAATFWSPFQTQAHSPTSTSNIRPRTSSSSKGTLMLKQSATVNDDKRRFLLDLKQILTGLLLSDLGAMIFSNGSETDAWFSGELGEECIQRKEQEDDRRRRKALARKKSMKSMKSSTRAGPLETLGRAERSQPAAPVATLQHAGSDHQSAGEHSTSSDATTRSSSGMSMAKRAGLLEFPFNVAFRRILHKFATHPNPFSKLHALYELELLIVASLNSRSGRHFGRREALPAVPQSPTLGENPELSSRESETQVSTAQNLDEAIANCEERRSHSMIPHSRVNGTASPTPFRTSSAAGTRSPGGPPSTDMIVEVLQGLFRDANIRPKTLFRDLQYIASFVPAQMLDKTARGKAFWDVGLAALGLKQDVCRVMVRIADEIVSLDEQARPGKSISSSNANSGVISVAASTQAAATGKSMPSTAGSSATSTPPPPTPTRFTMEDAARMYIITAKEGDAAAGRELAIFYLTHPDVVQRTVLPLAKPSEVFKSELLQRDRKKDDPVRSDPITMCIAHHWMEMSMKLGDPVAAKYLRAREEIERIP